MLNDEKFINNVINKIRQKVSDLINNLSFQVTYTKKYQIVIYLEDIVNDEKVGYSITIPVYEIDRYLSDPDHIKYDLIKAASYFSRERYLRF